MAVTVGQIKIEFNYDGDKLKNIEGLSPSEVQEHYSRTYPELLNAKLIEHEIEDGVKVYEFKVINGVKG